MKYTKIAVLLFLLISIIPFKTYANTSSNITPPTINSESVILMDSESGQILYHKNSSKRMYPASLTKIATAILAIEQGNLEDIVTVSEKARHVVGTRVYLEEGEQVQLYKLIQGLLINSGNDAAIAIAEHIDGSVEAFADHLNRYLKDTVKVKNTHFTNPHGLFDVDHYTTAHDIAKIMKYALKNQVFQEIISTSELEWHGMSWDTTLYNHHKMLRERPYDGIIGGKTGYVDQSKQTLVTAAKRENISLIAVVLKANTKKIEYDDTEALLDYGFKYFQTDSIPAGETFTSKKNETYLTTKPILFTKKIGEEEDLNVSSKGKLAIIAESGKVLVESRLKTSNISSLSEPPKLKEDDNNTDLNGGGSNWFTAFAIIGLIGIFSKKIKAKKISIRK